jgi:hypothetical protein
MNLAGELIADDLSDKEYAIKRLLTDVVLNQPFKIYSLINFKSNRKITRTNPRTK